MINSRIRLPFYIFFLNPVYVAARSLRSLRSNVLSIICMEEVSFLKPFFSHSINFFQNFCPHFKRYHWLRKFPRKLKQLQKQFFHTNSRFTFSHIINLYNKKFDWLFIVYPIWLVWNTYISHSLTHPPVHNILDAPTKRVFLIRKITQKLTTNKICNLKTGKNTHYN